MAVVVGIVVAVAGAVGVVVGIVVVVAVAVAVAVAVVVAVVVVVVVAVTVAVAVAVGVRINRSKPLEVMHMGQDQAQDQAQAPAQASDHPYEIGEIYLIRTVTMIDTGRVVAVTAQEIVLEDAAWIADTGRFTQAIAQAEFSEVEPFPDGRVIIGRGAVIDAVRIPRAPRTQK